MSKIWGVLTRKKTLNPVSIEETRLSRILGTFDLTALGVGSTLGVGVYVLAGKVAKDTAGPSVILSFFIAAVVSVFAGLCYAEFGARVPKAGSAYIYSYVCIGEFAAFVIGWNLILEYIIGSASVARGISLYLDTLLNNTLETTFKDIAPIHLSFMSEYFDFLAFGLSIILAIAMSFGLKESSLVNNIVTSLNIGIVLFVVILGSIKANVANWHFHPDNTTNSTIVGTGGFFPFGLDGTIKGAATCFYGFVGFDCIATTGEEVRNPKKAIPISIILSLAIIFLAYFGISTVLTLMVPYYLQDENAPLPYAFDYVGWHWAKWVVAIGGICGLFSSLFGAMFPLPRIIYAMASDGLIFRFLGSVSSRFHTPVIGTILAGVLTGSMGALFELSQLVNMMSIGTLMAYTVVAASVLLLRYSVDNTPAYTPLRVNTDSDDNEPPYTENSFNNTNNDDSYLVEENKSNSSVIAQIFNCGRHSNPTKVSQNIVAFNIALYCIACVAVGLCAIYLKDPIAEGKTWAIVLVSIVILLATILIISVAIQPTSNRDLSFKVPVVPLIPALSILANIYLMLMLDYLTWIRFGVWMAVGLPIYYISLKPIDEQKPKASAIDEHKPIETGNDRNQNGKVNYYNNVAFVDDTFNYPKKKTAPLPPQINEDKTEVNEIHYELQKLDEMLDEVSNNLETTRKSSVCSVNVSMSREESVVADVHCNNVTTPAIPFPTTTSVEDPTILNYQNDINEHLEPLEVQKEAPPVEIQKKKKRSGSIDSPAPPDTPVSYKSVTAESESEINDSSASISSQPTPPESPLFINKVEEVFDTPIPLSPKLTPPQSPLLVKTINESEENIFVPPSSSSQSPLPVDKIEEENVKVSVTPPPPPFPLFVPGQLNETTSNDIIKPQSPVQRVTSSAIKGVTLKSWRKQNDKTKNEYVPDDENLKLRSEKAKSFKEQLNNKLSTNFPNHIPFLKYHAPLPPIIITATPIEPRKNENVIEESISRESAREKLGLYINARLVNSSNNISSNNKSEEITDIPLPISRPTSNEVVQTDEIVPVVETVDDAYLAHQNRMKNVFRSMKMMDTPKELNSPTRIVKSLDHKIDDHAKHRQAMSEIFDTINLRRKESTKQQSKV
ncbi:high affinity cationic amino acid transporter 1-like isoform X1 [Diorhabda sublineata]|uniref:high affinity cationic amino acid transporter 1-like isoform X1 n=1 Tax=Diorhabda sublineata TaxID=1163346 RepID=UPI0024E06628|nr:high affinity cationic amino acid transporter 1-like isoform X1 [Diorhabda sublineata]XP_056647778.1 high affinity cationic amino acid transporter 1-like isoform X1 [Diorhabda sublineata]XP_056647779.1 high affinity cationic amino acid transporter 1-like isoform X1 [Diorhabda sublineata]XP_056647780.1 high affinity cationic amino acid transporter 1-like isoform X1 [Diorhabda sublineata]